jgi:hypothetical protein
VAAVPSSGCHLLALGLRPHGFPHYPHFRYAPQRQQALPVANFRKEGLAGPGSRQIWAPATSFVLPPTRQAHYGLRLTGSVEHLLKPDGRHFSRLVPVPGLECPSLADYPEAYAQYLEAGHFETETS